MTLRSLIRNPKKPAQGIGGRCPRFLRWILAGLFLGLIFWFYLWTATQGLPVPWRSKPVDLYNRLTDAFLAGQLSLLEPPSSELLSLPDPYDPKQNALLRLHDASLYREKYFLYFGVTPVFLLFLPFRLFSAGLPQMVAGPLFFFAGLLAALAVLKALLDRYANGAPFRMIPLALIAISLSSAIPFALRRPGVYEVAIACGYFCFMVAFYFFLSWHAQNSQSLLRLSLGSLFWGLAVGARPSWILGSPLLMLVSFLALRRLRGFRLRQIAPSLLSLWAPFLLVLFLIGLYNFLRFDSWLEFGTSYQLAGFHPQKLGQFQRDSLWPGLYFYLWQPLQYDWAFPFLHAVPRYPGDLPKEYTGLEPVAGLLALAPFIYVIPLFLLFKSLPAILKPPDPHRASPGRPWLPWILFLLGTGTLQILLLSLKPGATMRYVADFAPLFILSASFLWTILYQRWAMSSWARNFIFFFGVLTILYGCTVNGAISLTGYFDPFRRDNPEQYQALKENVQRPTLWIASKFVAPNLILLEIENPYGKEKEDGDVFYWLGPRGAKVEVYCKKEGLVGLWAEMLPGPSIAETPQRRLLIRTNQGFESEVRIFAPGEKAIPIQMRPGVNRIAIYPLDPPTVQPPPGKAMADLRIFLLRLQKVRLEELRPPAIIGVENQNGLERTPEGIPFFWIGQGETVITFLADRKGTAVLHGGFHPGPSIPETKTRRLLLKTNHGFEKEFSIPGPGEQQIPVEVEPGSNLIFLTSLDSPTHRLDHDPRPLLLMARDLKLKEFLQSSGEADKGKGLNFR